MTEFRHMEEMVVGFYDREIVQFSNFEFPLKSGRRSPLYYNQRKITSFNPNSQLDRQAQRRIRELAVIAFTQFADQAVDYDHLFGIPQSMTALGGAIAEKSGESLLWGRVGKKDYGISSEIEGDFAPGQKVVALDDVITNADSKLQTVDLLKANGLEPTAFVIMFDREEGGAETLRAAGQELIAVTGLTEVMQILRDNDRIGTQEQDWMGQYHAQLRAAGEMI